MVQNILQAKPGQIISSIARSGLGFMVRVKVRVRVGMSVRVIYAKEKVRVRF